MKEENKHTEWKRDWRSEGYGVAKNGSLVCGQVFDLKMARFFARHVWKGSKAVQIRVTHEVAPLKATAKGRG